MPKKIISEQKKKAIREIWEEQKQFHASDKLYGNATIGARGQVVIPAEVRKDFGLKPGDQLMILGNGRKKAMIMMKSGTLNEFLGIIMQQVSGSGIEGDVMEHFRKVFAGSKI